MGYPVSKYPIIIKITNIGLNNKIPKNEKSMSKILVIYC
jgi:hypothetical protein